MINNPPTIVRAALAAVLLTLVLHGAPAGARGAGEPVVSEVPAEPERPAPAYGGPALRGPVDPDEYIVGPGDRFSVTLWGQSVVSFTETVTPEGELVLPGIATIPVAGERLEAVKRGVRARLAERYKNVEVSVSLTELRRIQVNVLGEVASPGVYVGTALDPSSVLVEKAGGLLEGASLRNIEVGRRDGETDRLDLVRYANTSDVSANPPILDGDVIFVPHATSFVRISGGVARPDLYEFVAGETVESLIEVAGGLARGAFADTVEIHRFDDDLTTSSFLLDVSSPAGRTHRLRDGDQVVVRVDPHWRVVRSVGVEGEVVYPGDYGIDEGADRLSDVLERAGGPTAEASLKDARIMRLPEEEEIDPEFERLKAVAANDMSDTEYAYFKTKSRARSGAVVVDFESVLAGDESQDVLLAHGDVIVVPRAEVTVEVAGQVASPGKVPHVPGKRYEFYVEQAGGYTSTAKRNSTRVIKSGTGEHRKARLAGVLEPGDAVWVPETPEGDWWESLQEVVGFATSLLTIYLLLERK